MSDGPELRQNRNGPRSIRYLGKEYQAPVFDSDQLSKKLASIPKREKTLLFIPSPLFLDNISVLLSLLPASAHVLCVEADQMLMSFSLSHSSPGDVQHDGFTYIRTDSPASVTSVVDKLGIWRFRRCCMLTFNRAYSLNAGIYTAVYQSLQAAIQRYWQNKMTLIHMGSMWIKNLFKNLPVLSEVLPITALQVSKPVCVIGAGESLEHSLETLQKFREQFFLICVDTALPVLRESGFAPDLIVILETQSANLKDFIGHQGLEIPVAFDLTSHPGAHSIFKGNKYCFLSEFMGCSLVERIKQNFPEVHFVPSLGSVGVTAVYLGALLTDLPVFFTGLDFSYVPGKPHSRGAPSQLTTLSTSNRLSPAGYFPSAIERRIKKTEDKHRKPCYTDAVLQSYIEPLRTIVGNQDRFYDIGSSGLPTGAQLLKEDKSIAGLLNAVSRNERTIRKSVFTETPGISSDRIDRFLSDERARLSEVVTLGRDIITGKKHSRMKAELEGKLQNIDYIYTHFPETPPLPFGDITFIKRIVVSAGYYHAIIQNCIAG